MKTRKKNQSATTQQTEPSTPLYKKICYLLGLRRRRLRRRRRGTKILTLDGHGEEVDVLQGLDLVLLDQTAELGDGHPLLVVIARASATTPAATPAITPAPSEAAAA